MQHDTIMSCTFSYKKNYYLIRNQKKTNILLHPHFQKYFIPHRNCHHHCEILLQQYYMTSSYVVLFLWYVPNFINTPLRYCWHWIISFRTAILFHNSQNIFQTSDTKGATEIDLNTFQFGKHSFQFSVRN